MNELKPCPFCGGKAKIFKRGDAVKTSYIPHCVDVHCMGRNLRPYPTMESAIIAWNKRKTQDERRGHWTEVEGMLVCSECGHSTEDVILDTIAYDGDTVFASLYPFYCGKCGARMVSTEAKK